MAIELRTDSRYCYMLYRSDERYLPFDKEEERRKAVEIGRRFAASAYADVWANNPELVQRVRRFLSANFHWHERLAKLGSNRDVVEMLLSMIQGGSVAVVPEEPRHEMTGIAWPPKRTVPSFRNAVGIDDTPYISVAEKYRAQLQRIESERTTWGEAQAIMDNINAGFMRKLAGYSPLLDALFETAGWAAKYTASESTGSSPLSDALPFVYGGTTGTRDGAFDIAGLPFNGPASSWVESGSGMKKQWRMYKADGTPSVDIDFDDHHGQPNPHAHNWSGLERDQGWPVSILP
jgi:hypothetical protein